MPKKGLVQEAYEALDHLQKGCDRKVGRMIRKLLESPQKDRDKLLAKLLVPLADRIADQWDPAGAEMDICFEISEPTGVVKTRKVTLTKQGRDSIRMTNPPPKKDRRKFIVQRPKVDTSKAKRDGAAAAQKIISEVFRRPRRSCDSKCRKAHDRLMMCRHGWLGNNRYVKEKKHARTPRRR